jgi:hypothetical protein
MSPPYKQVEVKMIPTSFYAEIVRQHNMELRKWSPLIMLKMFMQIT